MSVEVFIRYDEAMREEVVVFPQSEQFLKDVREVVPGAMWDGQLQVWRAPLTRRAVMAVRGLLTGVKGLKIKPEDGVRLARAADSPPTPDVTLVDDSIVVKVENYPPFHDALKLLGAERQIGGEYLLTPDKADEMVTLVTQQALDIHFDDAVLALRQDQKRPPAAYDATLMSLSEIPLTELNFVSKADKSAKNSKAKKKAKMLSARLTDMGLLTWWDLLNHAPIRYIDRSSPKTIAELTVGEDATLVGTITSITPYDRQRRITRITITDVAGATLTVTFFNQAWLSHQFRANMEVIIHGKCDLYTGKNGRSQKQISSPKIDALSSKRGERPMIPIYPQSERSNVTTWDILNMTDELLSRLAPTLKPSIPDRLMQNYRLLSRHESYQKLHFPSNQKDVEEAKRTLGYEEMLRLQVFINSQRFATERLKGLVFDADPAQMLVNQYVENLPYALTGAQDRAIKEIMSDVTSPTPMHRLLQGDVSSGKSTIAMVSLLTAVANGYQGILMAPTEILAEQLFNSIVGDIAKHSLKNLQGQDITVEFLGHKTTARNKKLISERAKSGELDIVVGTHAVLYQKEGYANLGLVVIDEQHRFGTQQRTQLRDLREDGVTPHMLVMTATPIPRTSAMVLYGDLDVTVLNELPPGRIKIETEWIRSDGPEVVNSLFHPVWEDMKKEVAKGHQGYIVASLVEDNERVAAQSTQTAYEQLSAGALSGVRLGMVHGKQSRKEREEIMAAFAKGELDVLVATTVIEVGVNVPNATLMVVLDAGQFGISQLHQIRGRVGRSSLPSRCYLVTDTHTTDGVARMEALVESTDGFFLAERDLEIRGEGTLFSSQQSGASDLKIASLKNMSMLKTAAKDAKELLEADSRLLDSPLLKEEIFTIYEKKTIDS